MAKKRKNSLQIVALSFTNRCNLSCTHCGYDNLNRDPRRELPIDFFIQALTEARTLGAHGVNITGGEIFLRPDCLDLVTRAAHMGYFVTLESNGTLIKDEHIHHLKTLGKKVRLAISLDGIKPETHEAVRGPNTYARTIEVLHKLSAARVPTRINTVMQRGNLNEIPNVARFAVKELGIGFRLLPFILEYGKGACVCKTDGVPYDDIERVMEGFMYPFMRSLPEGTVTLGLKMALVPIDIEGHLICPWGQSMIGIGPSGIASLCHVTNNLEAFGFGDLKEQSLTDIWQNSPRLRQFREFDPATLKGICGNCLARNVCRGGCRLNAYASFGDFLAPDPQCQAVYELGRFPVHALEDDDWDCTYTRPLYTTP